MLTIPVVICQYIDFKLKNKGVDYNVMRMMDIFYYYFRLLVLYIMFVCSKSSFEAADTDAVKWD